jgi:hypothetical protein
MALNLKASIVKELHRPARKRFPRRNTVLKGNNDLFQADLVELIPHSKVNKGNKYILTVINCFSKVADAFPLKDKTGKSVSKGMETIIKRNNFKIKHLQTDDGKEYFNSIFKNLVDKYGINHYSTNSEIKAAIVERFNRTLKGEMYRKFSLRGSYKWFDILPQIIHHYNNKVHRTIGMKPKDVNETNEKLVLKRIINNTRPIIDKKPPRKFNVGEQVRISKHKSIFTKGYIPNWTNEVFEIFRVQPTLPETYYLRDKKGEILQGGFYGHEISKSNTGDVYLVEKVLKRKDDKVLVRWLGFNQSQDSWIPKKDML